MVLKKNLAMRLTLVAIFVLAFATLGFAVAYAFFWGVLALLVASPLVEVYYSWSKRSH